MIIYIIDDNISNCKLIKYYMKKWGYKSKVYTDSKKSYDDIKKIEESAVIILDWMMPEMSGLDIINNLNRQLLNHPIYIILLTAKSSMKDLVEALNQGADDFISKPFDEMELKSRLSAGIRVLKLQKQLKNKISEKNILLKSINSIIIGFDKDNRIIQWNKKAENYFSIRTKNVLDKKIEELKINWEKEKVINYIQKCKKNNKPIKNKEIYLKKEKKQHILLIDFNPYINEGEIGCLIVASDVTKNKLLENRLLKDQKLKSLGQFANGMSHEINNPLQIINFNISALKKYFNLVIKQIDKFENIFKNNNSIKEKMDEDQINFIKEDYINMFDDVQEGVSRIEKIVGKLSKFSGKDKIEQTTTVDLNKLLKEIVSMFKKEMKNIELKFDLDKKLPKIKISKSDMNLALYNIFDNTIKSFDKEDNNIIIVKSKREDEYIKINIKDNGMGIKEDIQGMIFTPLFTTRDAGEGTGLSLFISYDVIVNKHKGILDFESIPDKGTNFIIKLPINN